jgi:serine-type D-Ala-D-Ala carboxypeptidase/endopeptidase (penicillin-binding protein 4)
VKNARPEACHTPGPYPSIRSTRPSSDDLKADLDQILSDSRLNGASVGLIVRDAQSGAVLYDHDSSTQETPGSNNKLQTSTAAFGLLGSDYRFHTKVAVGNGRPFS